MEDDGELCLRDVVAALNERVVKLEKLLLAKESEVKKNEESEAKERSWASLFKKSQPAETKGLEKRVEALRGWCEKLEAQDRRDNLIFRGLEESPMGEIETDADVERKLRKLLRAKGIPSEVSFERVHRLGKVRREGRPRLVIAKFSRYKDRESVWRSKRMLKGSNVYVDEDYPAFIREKREVMRRHAFPISKAQGVRYDLKFPFDEVRVAARTYYYVDVVKDKAQNGRQEMTPMLDEVKEGTRGNRKRELSIEAISPSIESCLKKPKNPTVGAQRKRAESFSFNKKEAAGKGIEGTPPITRFFSQEKLNNPFVKSTKTVRSPGSSAKVHD